MATLRQEQEETAAKCEELQAKVKTLEQENLAKEQEIKSLSHNNQRLEGVVEKLEEDVQKHKDIAKDSGEQINQSESLQRRLQLLEEEAEEADKNMRETNEKYVIHSSNRGQLCSQCDFGSRCSLIGYVKQMSKLVTTSERFKLWKRLAINGKRSMRRCRRSTSKYNRICTISRKR